MRHDAETAYGDPGPEEVAMRDWLEETSPYITLPEEFDPETDGEDD